MFVLPSALAAMGAYRQFIVYELAPSKRVPGKTDKYPRDWRDPSAWPNAHNPEIWLSWQDAASYAAAFGPAFGVGFVFTKADPFWFLDLDGALLPDGSGWSPLALEMLSRLQGAGVEISQSGKGLHIIGHGQAPEHRKRRDDLHMEFYTEERFVALTGTNALGDAGTDHTAAIAEIAALYFPPTQGDKPDDWTAAVARGRDPRWNGPEDDAELIRRAMLSESAASAFGNKASFADLFTGDVDALAKAYPDDKGRPYNASSADSGLAQHLAFWTGKDAERILRIMQMSALKRAKWDEREDYYLPRTILGVIARQNDVLQDKPREATPAVPPPMSGAPQGVAVTGETFLNSAEQIALFQGCVYICHGHRVLVPGGHLLKPDQFKVMFGGFSFVLDAHNTRISHNAWEAFVDSQLFRSPRADVLCFRPDRPPGEIVVEGGLTLANVWWPIETPRAQGDAGKFVRHVQKLFPDGDDAAKLMAYLAAVKQYPGRKFQWAPLIQGVKGNGKSFLGTALSYCVGDRYTHLPNATDLAGGMKFTGWLERKLLVVIEELHTGDKREMAEALKPLITNSRIEIQAKGQDQVTGDNRANIIAFSNFKDAVPKTADERRWGIFFSAQQSRDDLTRDGMAGNYFPDLWDWARGTGPYAGQPPGFAIVNDYLQTYAIPDELNPATLLHRAPDTTSTYEAMELSVGSIEQEILEAIEQDQVGFAGGWVSSIYLDNLLKKLRAERRVPPRKRRQLMLDIGYDWLPALRDNNGRVNNVVVPDGGKPRLFVKIDSILAKNIQTNAQAATMYAEAQQKALASAANSAKFGT